MRKRQRRFFNKPPMHLHLTAALQRVTQLFLSTKRMKSFPNLPLTMLPHHYRHTTRLRGPKLNPLFPWSLTGMRTLLPETVLMIQTNCGSETMGYLCWHFSWRSYLTGSASSSPSVWPPLRLVAMGRYLGLDCLWLNGSWLSGFLPTSLDILMGSTGFGGFSLL